jgi:predicted transcriptional regulator
MTDAPNLLFELASPDRLDILREIEKEPLKLSRAAQKQSATVQETFRQLQRLASAGLVKKNAEGAYELTPLGRLALALVPSFGFLGRESEFILTHDLTRLPQRFQERIGDLLGSRRVDHLDDLLATEERIIEGSEKFVWFMSDQLFGHPRHQSHASKLQRISMKLLLPRGLDTNELQSSLGALGVDFEIGVVDRIDLLLVLNEKACGVAFPSLDGRLDYGRGFVGDSEEFHNWCSDIYSHYWARAKKIGTAR